MEGLPDKPSRPRNVQTFPSIMICVLVAETVQKWGIVGHLTLLLNQAPHGVSYTDLIFGILKAQDSVTFDIPKL